MQMHPEWDSYSQKNSLSISPCKCTQCAILTVRKIAHVMTFFNFVFLNTSWNKVNPLQTDGLNTEGTCVQPVAIQESGLGPVKQISALQCTVYEKTGFFLSLSFLLSLSYSCLSKCSVWKQFSFSSLIFLCSVLKDQFSSCRFCRKCLLIKQNHIINYRIGLSLKILRNEQRLVIGF